MAERPWGATPSGIIVTVRLTPKAARDAIEGVEPLVEGRAALKARVRAPPAQGEANAALIALIAKATGVAKRDISLVTGLSARIKRLKIAGPPAALCAAFERICASGGHSR
jgi:uncharacterized protein (TIGR00251 family)